MKLLADRGTGGISVRLLWDDESPSGNDVVVEYEDLKEGVTFTLRPPPDRALDAYYHPNAWAWIEWGNEAA